MSECLSLEAEDLAAWTLMLNYLTLSGRASELSNAFKNEEPIECGKGDDDAVYFTGEESLGCFSFFEKRITFLLWIDAEVVDFDVDEFDPLT